MEKDTKKLLIRSRKKVFGERAGNNPSIFKGEGFDFVELREYQPEDDIKKIDWNISAKLGSPHVKLFQEERELNIVIVSVLNSSTYFGSHKMKNETIAEISAILSFSALKNRDQFNNIIFTDEVNFNQKPSKSFFAVSNAVENIVNFDPREKDFSFAKLEDFLRKRIKRRSVIFIISDFWDIPDFKYLAKKHDLTALIVRDRIEEKPPEFGFTTLIDANNFSSLEGEFSGSSTEDYFKKVKIFDSKLIQHFRKSGIRYKKLYTHSDIFKELLRFFNY